MAITTYIKTADPIILNRMSDILGNISSVLKDTDAGKVGTREVHFILGNLKLSSVGVVQSVTTTNTTPYDNLLGVETFDPQMSLNAVTLYQRLSNLDQSIVELSFDPDSDISSPLYYANIVKGNSPVFMSYIYVELYSLYKSIVEYKIGTVFPISPSEFDRIISNLSFISTVIGSVGDDEDVYKLLYVVKYIHRSILFIRYHILTILG